MSCQVEQIGDCGDISSIARALFISNKEDENWLTQCQLSLSPCGNLLAIANNSRLCLLTSQWISTTESNTYLMSWSGTLPSDVSAILVLSICPTQQSSQNGPDWFCIVVGFQNGYIGFYTNTGHLLMMEKLEEKPVMKISCHTGTYGTLPDDLHVLYSTCQCIIVGNTLFPVLRSAKAQVAMVQAGVQESLVLDIQSINIRKWVFSEQELINDAVVVGLELKNTYDHLLAASTYGGYDTWYRSIPPLNSLILTAGMNPYVGFHYALEGGSAPPLQDVARAVANKIKSALPGWLGGAPEAAAGPRSPLARSEGLALRHALSDAARAGRAAAQSPDRRLAAVADGLGRVAVLDVTRSHLIRMFKGCRDAQLGFMQVFDVDSKRPQMSIAKELRRAVFLIIYNPKKGLVDIRVMQRGSRVATFSASKHGRLLTAASGMVGAERAPRRLNAPDLPLVLLDPDGKLKKFNIPFFYALEGDHSHRSKDLHILRELREHLKKIPEEDFQNEIISKATRLKTLDLQKHCLEMLIRSPEVPPKLVMTCLEMFWNSMSQEKLSDEDKNVKDYFENLAYITRFYREINDESVDDMLEFMEKIQGESAPEREVSEEESAGEEDEPDEIELLQDDGCVVERLLLLAHENDYETGHARVTFADAVACHFRDFVACFQLAGPPGRVVLRPGLPAEPLARLAARVHAAVLTAPARATRLRRAAVPAPLLQRLLLEHACAAPLAAGAAPLRRLAAALRAAGGATRGAGRRLRAQLAAAPCPLRALCGAAAARAAAHCPARDGDGEGEGRWEALSHEDAAWALLLGKLEDVALLSVALAHREPWHGAGEPRLPGEVVGLPLRRVYRAGAVPALLARWLCGLGAPAAAVAAHARLAVGGAGGRAEQQRGPVDDNPRLFKWLELLRRQFPHSASADYVVADMCWELAAGWRGGGGGARAELLGAALRALGELGNSRLRCGLCGMLWVAHVRPALEAAARLVHKVGRRPAAALCLQDTGLDDGALLDFLRLAWEFLAQYQASADAADAQAPRPVLFEKMWENEEQEEPEGEEEGECLVRRAASAGPPAAVALAQARQLAGVVYFVCHFNVKCSKPLDSLFDMDLSRALDAVSGAAGDVGGGAAGPRARAARERLLTRLVRAAVDTVSVGGDAHCRTYDNHDCVHWMRNFAVLAELWDIDEDYLVRQQCIAQFHVGQDALAGAARLRAPARALPPLLALALQRLKRSLQRAAEPHEWIVTVPPHLYRRLTQTPLDPSVPADPCLETTMLVLQELLNQMDKKSPETEENLQNIKFAELIIETCDVLIKRKL